MEIFLQNKGAKEGPFSVEQIQQRLDAGTLSKTSLAWCEGFSNWLPVLAVLTPRARPPTFKPKPETTSTAPVVQENLAAQDQNSFSNQTSQSTGPPTASADARPAADFLGRRVSGTSQFTDGLGQLKQVGWATVFPLKAFQADKPWNLVWVRWLLLLSCIPISLLYLTSTGHLDSEQATFVIGIYAALFWVFGLFMVLNPEGMSFGKWLWFCGLPVVFGVVLLMIARRVHFIGSVYGAVASDSILTKVSASIGISLLNQAFIGLPLFLSSVRKAQPDSSRTIAFWGFVAGLAYGFAPTITGLLESRSHFSSGSSVIMLLRTTILTGLLGGILGCFIAAAAQNKQLIIGLTVAGVLTTGVIAGLTMAFSDSIVGWVLGIFAALMFVAHVRKEMVNGCA